MNVAPPNVPKSDDAALEAGIDAYLQIGARARLIAIAPTFCCSPSPRLAGPAANPPSTETKTMKSIPQYAVAAVPNTPSIGQRITDVLTDVIDGLKLDFATYMGLHADRRPLDRMSNHSRRDIGLPRHPPTPYLSRRLPDFRS